MNTKDLTKIMTDSGLLVYEKETPLTVRLDRDETDKLLKRKINYSKYDSHCEIVHMEISNRCNMDCSYCYIRDKNEKELEYQDWIKIIDNLASYGVFQITFGGGEPTLYPYFIDLAEYAVTKRNLNVGMTTNGKKIHEFPPKLLKKYFRQINISWHQNPETVSTALYFLRKNEIKAGINYCFSQSMGRNNKHIKNLAKKYDAEILYLAYKPVIGDYDNLIDPKEVYRVAKETADEGLKVGVDGPCVGLCMMKKRFADIDFAGNVFPCSFVRKSMGNALHQDFKEIWANRGEQDDCPYLDILSNRKEQ